MEDKVNESFELTLSKQIAGEQVLDNPVCLFHYEWDESTNMGIAMLQSINSTPVNIVLHPLGIEGQLDFMSDMEPTTYSVKAANDNGTAMVKVVIYRVILDITKEGKEAAIMFNEDGSSIEGTDGIMDESAARNLELPAVEFETPEAPEGAVPPIAESAE